MAPPFRLKKDEENGTNNRDEIEGQIHEVSNDCFGTESLEWFLQCLSEFLNRITAGFDLSPFLHNLPLVSREQCAVEGVENGIFQKKVARDSVDDCSTFVEDQKDGADHCDRTVHEYKDRELGEIGKGKHAS